MNERKQKVMEAAQQLFIEKGYSATSIQDILTESGISKGTFYNYFSSKNELLISIFEKINEEAENKRQALIVGKPVHDKDVFIEQVKVRMEVNKRNNLFALFQGVFSSEEEEMKQYVKQHHLNELRWAQRRLVEVYGMRAAPYAVDLAIMLFGTVHNAIHLVVALDEQMPVRDVIAYSMRRVDSALDDIIARKDVLIEPHFLEQQFTQDEIGREQKKSELLQVIGAMQQSSPDQSGLLLFLQEEARAKKPRRAVMEAVAASIPDNDALVRGLKAFFGEGQRNRT